MSDDTPARKRRSSGPQSDAEPTESGAAPDAPEAAPDPPTAPPGTPPGAPGGDAAPASVAGLLTEADRLIVNIQIASPNPELTRVRVLLGQAAELAGGGEAAVTPEEAAAPEPASSDG